MIKDDEEPEEPVQTEPEVVQVIRPGQLRRGENTTYEVSGTDN